MGEIRWNREQSGERHFHDEKVRYNFVIYNPSYHYSIKDKVIKQFTDFEFSSGLEEKEEYFSNKDRTVMKYLFFSFETSRNPDKIRWNDITSMPVKKDRKLSKDNKKGIENYLSDLYSK